MPFTGTADVIRFKGLLNEVLIQNELGGASPYAMSSAKAGRSGYSFGVPQYDLSVSGSMAGAQTARDLFKDILSNATDSNGNYLIDDGNSTTSRQNDALVAALYNKAILVGGASLLPSEKVLIDAALNSVYGRQEIDGALDLTLRDRLAVADRVIALTTGADRAFLESDLGKLFLCDYENQYKITPGGALEQFVQGLPALGVTKQGDLGVGDLLNFYFHTQQARQTPHDPVRRFANVVEFSGGYAPGNTAADLADAKQVLQAYTFFVVPNKAQINSANAGALAEFMTRVINPAKAPVISAYAQGHTINGEVLVGEDDIIPGETLTGTGQNDLLFGENGHDTLKGEAGDDVLYGGEGTDTLIGGTGNDYLDGGAGYDTYVYRINDGQDIIRDSDGKGSLYYDGQLVTGGIHRDGDPADTYRSLDGTMTFVQSGTDLLVNNLITIQNYTPGSGVLGITLRDLSANPTDPGVPTGPFVFTVTLGPGDVNGSLPEGLSGPGAVYGNELSNILDGSISLNDEFGDLLDGGRVTTR